MLDTDAAALNEIFWMMFDLFRPVPAAAAPAFCTKKTSSVGGYLLRCQIIRRTSLRNTYQTTAS
jgi:hypothetical protein